jgi:pimeloyl-ACP methyl ester carboxylesterase
MKQGLRLVCAGAALALAVFLAVALAGGSNFWPLLQWFGGGSSPHVGHRGEGGEGWEWREVWFGNGASVAFAMRSGHGPPILLLHGRPGNAEQGRVFADELFPAVRKRRVEQQIAPSEHQQQQQQALPEGKLPPYTFIIVSRPTPTRNGSFTPEEQEADLYSLLIDELDVTKVAVMSLPGAHNVAATFAKRHREKCWAVVQVAADAHGFDNCLTSTFEIICQWTPSLLRPLVARSIAFVSSRLASYEQVVSLPCMSVAGSDRATRLLQMRLVATTIPCVIDLLSSHTHADVVATSGDAIPWLQVTGPRDDEEEGSRSARVPTGTGSSNVEGAMASVPGLVGARMAFPPRQLGPMLEQFLEKATQFLVW